jgi:branched-chain amino acid transport system substrate-binding protein
MKKALGLILVALFLAAGLGFGQTVVAKEWTIPFLNCLTGPIAAYGELFQWSAERAASEINAAGGIKGKPVKIVGVDTGSDPQKGSTSMAFLVSSTLVALGPVPEPVILAAMPIAVENKMVSITATTSYEYAAQFFPWTISWFPPTEKRLGVLVGAWAKKYPAMKKVVQIMTNYGPWPGMVDAHAKALTGMGITMGTNVEVPQDAVTFGPLVVKALDQKPDGIVISTFPDKTAKIIQELKSRGWTNMNQILVFSSGDAPDLYTTGGKDINGVSIYNYINPDISNPRWDAVKAAYSKDHNGTEAPSLLTNYYDAVYMIKEAIEKTGVTGDPAKLAAERKLISDYIANVKGFQGVMFTWDMQNGIPTNKPSYIFTIQDSKKINVTEVR